jgi:hypothetical protein
LAFKKEGEYELSFCLPQDGCICIAFNRNRDVGKLGRCLNCLPICAPMVLQSYIVSGGGIEFMRPWTERVYGIPPEQVIGSSIKTKFEIRNGQPVLVRLPEVNFIDDKAGKPVGINQHIGRRPIAAFGNSDGDLQMLQWTAAGKGARYMLYFDAKWGPENNKGLGKNP